MSQSKKPPPYVAPKIGEYFAYPRPIEGHYHVSRKGTPKSFFDLGHEFVGSVETLGGAQKLAQILNLVNDLGNDWKSVSTKATFSVADNETGARGIILHHVKKALGLKTDLEHPWREIMLEPTYDG